MKNENKAKPSKSLEQKPFKYFKGKLCIVTKVM